MSLTAGLSMRNALDSSVRSQYFSKSLGRSRNSDNSRPKPIIYRDKEYASASSALEAYILEFDGSYAKPSDDVDQLLVTSQRSSHGADQTSVLVLSSAERQKLEEMQRRVANCEALLREHRQASVEETLEESNRTLERVELDRLPSADDLTYLDRKSPADTDRLVRSSPWKHTLSSHHIDTDIRPRSPPRSERSRRSAHKPHSKPWENSYSHLPGYLSRSQLHNIKSQITSDPYISVSDDETRYSRTSNVYPSGSSRLGWLNLENEAAWSGVYNKSAIHDRSGARKAPSWVSEVAASDLSSVDTERLLSSKDYRRPLPVTKLVSTPKPKSLRSQRTRFDDSTRLGYGDGPEPTDTIQTWTPSRIVDSHHMESSLRNRSGKSYLGQTGQGRFAGESYSSPAVLQDHSPVRRHETIPDNGGSDPLRYGSYSDSNTHSGLYAAESGRVKSRASFTTDDLLLATPDGNVRRRKPKTSSSHKSRGVYSRGNGQSAGYGEHSTQSGQSTARPYTTVQSSSKETSHNPGANRATDQYTERSTRTREHLDADRPFKYDQYLQKLLSEVEASPSSVATETIPYGSDIHNSFEMQKMSKLHGSDLSEPASSAVEDQHTISGGGSTGQEGFLERIQQLLAQSPPLDTSIQSVSRATESVLDGDRSWEHGPSLKPLVYLSTVPEAESNTTTDSVSDLLRPKETPHELTLTGQSQPGSMEALKHILFTMQNIADETKTTPGGQQDSPNTSLIQNQSLVGETDDSQAFTPETRRLLSSSFTKQPGADSLERAMEHLSKLKDLVVNGPAEKSNP